jgi:hypothetical protein
MMSVRRCRYCPSPKLSAIRFRPIDYLLVCLGVRRRRCSFCGRVQWTWLLPRPLRWGLAVLLLGMLYVGSTGPVKWLHDHYRMADLTYARINRWVYWPLNQWVGAPPAENTSLSRSLHAYREWWSPSAQSLRSNDTRPFDAASTGETAPGDSPPQRLELEAFGEALEHRVSRPTGEPPQQ